MIAILMTRSETIQEFEAAPEFKVQIRTMGRRVRITLSNNGSSPLGVREPSMLTVTILLPGAKLKAVHDGPISNFVTVLPPHSQRTWTLLITNDIENYRPLLPGVYEAQCVYNPNPSGSNTLSVCHTKSWRTELW
ncbi:MAG: hypothetical protein ABL949_12045 [Fimbriimonadaceae bacterium]